MGAGDSIDIAQGDLHRLASIGSEPVVFIEVQSGSYFGEDDIERIEDDYKR
jgi:mannose-6-phosphate isomerase